ncbi:hypothetical protein TrCOL_g11901 [Triparma columacea]|uniref:Thiamine pyrimidine synthase n=1 Tax=Triparma columacea TaxID=722753 RepID=A0A9W7LAE5_9STRA|nr:hypothetical protein TrCOL_g11901 [Triparma columacea]
MYRFNELTCLLLFPLFISITSSKEEVFKLKLGLEWFLNPDHMPIVVAIEEGYFEDFGLDVEVIEPTDHWDADKEILAGTLDVATTEPLHLAQDAAKGKSVLGFSRFFHTDGGVMFLESSGITRPKDMCGKTIQYPGSPGPGGPAIVQTMVEADGGVCDVESYGKFNNGFYHTDALKDGNADVATLMFYNFEMIEAEQKGLRANYFSLKDWGVPDFCQLVLFTTPERYSELKPHLRNLVLAMRKATSFIHRNPKLAMRDYAAYTKRVSPPPARNLLSFLNPFAWARNLKAKKAELATMKATLPAFPNDNTLSGDFNDKLMSWLVQSGQVGEAEAKLTQPSKYYTNEIAT